MKTLEEQEKELKDCIEKIKEMEEKEKKEVEFVCCVCGSEEYHREYHKEIIGDQGLKSYCVCDGCSVIFKDPEAFSKK